MKKRTSILIVCLALTGTIASLGAHHFRSSLFGSGLFGRTAQAASADREPQSEEFPYTIKAHSTISTELSQLGLGAFDIHQLVEAAKAYADLSRVRPGTQYRILYSDPKSLAPKGIKFKFSPVEYLLLTKSSDGKWTAQQITEKIDVKLITFIGTVASSLWESAEDINMDPNLIAALTEIFAWQVDFSREVRAGDRWRLSVEQQFVKGKAIGWGSILAAEYLQSNGNSNMAALFRTDGENHGYFAPDGSSMRRMFLKSPIKFGHITSRFARNRFHPILKIGRPHLGVDYGAPIGTPVHTVGDGTIIEVSSSATSGNTLKVRHNSMYQTCYRHLKGFAGGIHKGSFVKQGQVIGYVGNTGLSTGPHLHFEFYEAGRFVDPLGKKFPTAEPVPPKLLSLFTVQKDQALLTLPSWPTGGPLMGKAIAAAPEEISAEVFDPNAKGLPTKSLHGSK